MREIKFRAWNKKLKKFAPDSCSIQIQGDDAHVSFDYFDGNFDTDVWAFSDVELMQYTGLKDKNGVEIYEGDIVKAFTVFCMAYDYSFEDNNDPKNTYEIVFDDGCFQFKNTKQWSDGSNDWRSIENVELFKVEVIGNIYENPELLKGE